MGKLLLYLLLALVAWVGVTLWREGPEHAFGGLFAMLAAPQYGEADAPAGRSQRLAEGVVKDPEAPAADEWWKRR
jgi:hypothetical protein